MQIPSLQGKTVLVTGATDGLGKAVSHKVAKAGATLLLHGRNRQKGEAVKAEIIAASQNENVHYLHADFSSLQEVKEVSIQIREQYPALQVLINNAGIGGGPREPGRRQVGKEGYELRLTINYLSPFVLTQNLLPLLTRSAPARIVNVASVGQSPLDFNDLQVQKRYSSFEAYTRSKLAQIIYGFTLAEKGEGSGVTVNSLHPASLMDTNMVNDFFGHSLSTVAEGADVVAYVAFAAELAGVTGAYFDQMAMATAAAQAYDPTARERLWTVSHELAAPFLVP